MKEKIFEALKTKYANLGFSTTVLEGVATQLSAFVTEEDKIATAVEGAEQVLKSFQSFADSRVNAFKTESDKYKNEAEQLKMKLAELEKGKGTPTPQGDDVPEYVKQMQTTMAEMSKTLQGFQKANVSQSLKEKFIAQMGENKVPESYYKATLIGREFEDETKMQEFVSAVKSQYETHQQDLANLGFTQTKSPEVSKVEMEKGSEELANQIRQRTKEIVEQNKN